MTDILGKWPAQGWQQKILQQKGRKPGLFGVQPQQIERHPQNPVQRAWLSARPQTARSVGQQRQEGLVRGA